MAVGKATSHGIGTERVQSIICKNERKKIKSGLPLEFDVVDLERHSHRCVLCTSK